MDYETAYWKHRVRTVWPTAQGRFDELVADGVPPMQAAAISLDGISYQTEDIKPAMVAEAYKVRMATSGIDAGRVNRIDFRSPFDFDGSWHFDSFEVSQSFSDIEFSVRFDFQLGPDGPTGDVFREAERKIRRVLEDRIRKDRQAMVACLRTVRL